MVDVVDKATRSRMMSGIRSKDTKPERQIRSALHKHGFRFRLNQATLPGKPDIVLKKYHAVIFIHGCFWHGHDCSLFKWPKTNSDFWKEKILRNRMVDAETEVQIKKFGWRYAVVWECALKGKSKLGLEMTVGKLEDWLRSSRRSLEIGSN